MMCVLVRVITVCLCDKCDVAVICELGVITGAVVCHSAKYNSDM